ncbi:hypothetical protein PBY51_022825 [Eleginops maclovinus]|uniref:Poly [ADP-ribose] polymerase n=1 Tax=Eleginops maclovinus TaxID=56733 RepID=A0AAN8ANJ5_ELEMC|nr:hypothetical protein PBY51_022825 [Eleginops maclovinus]
MADAYSYALLVELEENNIPRLKIKLVKYFQSKKSNGGDCEVQYENGSRTAVLRFHREEDRQNVLKKERHQIHLEKGVVNMTVRLPEDETTKGAPSDECVQNDDDAGINIPSGPDEHTPAVEFQTEANTGADETADEEKCSTACVLEHFPEKLEKEYLEMLVENVLKDLPDYTSAIPRFTLEVFPQSAVVTFQSGKENTEFVRRCPQNKRFAMKGLSVRPLEVTKQVLVDDTQSFGEDFLRIYFENAGGDVENLVLNEAEQSATITFEDHKAVQKIMKKKHRIQDKEIRVFPFYNSLGKALYGGQLCCKKVIHAVSPIYDKAYPQKPSAQLKRAVKGSLELAEKHNLVSVALPAISRNQGFPLDVCANTIVRAVKDYCSDKYGDNTLKTIHLVNNDDSAVQAMVAAARQEFGNLLVSSSQQPLPFKTTSSPVKQAGSVALAPNCLGQVQTKEGLDITLMKGNIENATTEVTVNTVFENLALNRGAVSNAIFVVFHAVTPPWGNGADKILSVIFKECLAKAEKMGLTSISFPAIGTGNLGFPKDLVASILLDTIDTFSRKKQPKHLKKVMIILYPLDAPTIKAFSDEFPKKFPSATGVPVPSSPQSTGPFSKVVSSPGMYETKMGSVVVQAVTGDISKETTDVIVNSSNDDFSLKSGVSKAILDAAGQAVEAECQTLGAKPHTGMIITQPGNLKSKKILHLVGKTDPVQINKVVKDALQMCMTGSYTSVSLPAIGTGQGNAKARQVADAMLDAVIEVLSQNTNGPLKTVRIVIFQQPMLKEFSNSMHHREATAPKDKSWIWNPFDKIKSLFVGGSDENPQKEEDFDIEEVKVDPVSFHICGESQAKVNSAKQRVKDLISKDQGSICIKDDDILHLSKANHQRIVVIQQTTGVSIRINRQQAQASLTIEGLSQDVLNASQEINEMLKSMRNEEELKKKLELVASVADWQYQQTGHQFQSFDLMANFKLEEAMEKKQPNIKRIDKLKGEDDIPAVWDPMPANSASVAITLNAGSPEHTEVLNLFKATCPRNIVKIERIQNPGLWKSLEIKKRDMELRNKHQNNERRLFHGTCVETAAYINEHGFNRSYAGKNATCYGNGTYFAVNASYSASNTYSRPDAKGEKRMYLCRVLTGDFTIGNQGMITTPAKGNVSLQKYDSVVDNTGKPSMFVIFHDSQAYPEYMITFV